MEDDLPLTVAVSMPLDGGMIHPEALSETLKSMSVWLMHHGADAIIQADHIPEQSRVLLKATIGKN